MNEHLVFLSTTVSLYYNRLVVGHILVLSCYRDDGVVVPCGKLIHSSGTGARALNYNEYIVYDTTQVKMRYLLKVKFDFKY